MAFVLSKICFAIFGLMTLLSSPSAHAFDFSTWDGLLKRYVAPQTINSVYLNAVDYKKLGKDQAWGTLVKNLEKVSLSSLKTREEKLAFWINVYNIMAAKMVLDHYPVDSIKDAGRSFYGRMEEGGWYCSWEKTNAQ